MALKFLNDGYFAGKVGIGTESPSYKFTAYGSSVDSEIVASFGSANDQNEYTAIGLSGFIASNGATKAGLALKRTATYGTGELHFLNNNTLDNSDMTLSDSKMMINSSGNVGIGTTSPLRKLSVFSTSIVSSEFKGSNAGHLIDISNSNASPTYNGIRFQHNNTFKMGVTHIADGTTRGYIQIGNGYATGNEILVVDGRTSNVGIGTTDPGQNLEISGQGNVAIRLTSTDSTTSTLQFADSDDVNVGMIQYDHGSNYMSFRTNDNERARITSAGNVGIGTTLPGAKLTVSGKVQVEANNERRYALQPSNWGYSTSYRTLILGSASTTYNTNDTGSVTLAFGVDVSGNSSGSFTGDGRELLFRNGAEFTTPNAANNGYHLDILVLNDGNVGIGTASPSNPLTVVGVDSIGIDDYILHNGDSNTKFGFPSNDTFKIRTSGVDRLNINSSGNVGIGTTSPSTRLEVAASATTSVDIAHFSNSNDVVKIKHALDGLGSGRVSIFDASNNEDVRLSAQSNSWFNAGNVGIGTTSPGNTLHVYKNATIGVITSPTVANAGFRVQDSGANMYVDGNSFVIDTAGYLTTTGSNDFDIGTNSTSRIKIKGSGNVGIGTTSPTSKLHVQGTSFFFDQAIFDDKIGIGTTSPTQKLHVAGNARVTGAYYDSNNSPGTSGQILSSTVTGTDWVSGSGLPGGPYLPLAGGTMTGTAGVLMPDNFRLKIGTSEDLLIFHDGTDSQIFNQIGDLKIRNDQNDGDIVFMSDNGSGGTTEYFTINGTVERNIFYKDTKHPDGVVAHFGNGDDLQIYHDGSNSYIDDAGTGSLFIRASAAINLTNPSGSENIARFIENDRVELYFNGVKKFETTSTGVTVTGDVQIDSALLSNQENTDVDTGTETVANVAIATYTAAFFDFVIKKTTNVRSGTVYACHDGTNVEFTETSTQDLGDTSDVTLSVDISGGNMRLQATTTSDDWSIKSLIRAI